MNITNKVTLLLCSMLAIGLLPWLGSWIHYNFYFPDGFFAYPMTQPLPKAPFSITVFILVSIICLGITAIYVFPQWFGFKKVEAAPRENIEKVKFPMWFWIGLFSWGVAVFLLWTKQVKPLWLLHWSDIPLFWGFTLMIDGWVYVRNGGKSMISKVPQEVIGIGMASMSGWMIFEFLNFFVEYDWYYPSGGAISQEQFLLYAILTTSGLLPLAFEWYTLFLSFPKFAVRFANGLRFTLGQGLKNILLWLSLAGLFLAGLFPDALFWAVWICPTVLLGVILDKIGVWTPFLAIGRGNWAPILLSALTYFVEGLCIEGQNYFSAGHFSDGVRFSEDPLYWRYSLPYVNEPHLFEMPVLGFFGYLPFGIYCWLWWIAYAEITGVPSSLYKDERMTPREAVSSEQ